MRAALNDRALIYLQIAQMLEDDILRGVYAEEDQVPSTNELARAFSINPATAGKGINLLVADGVLYKKRGLGMFVAQGAKKIILTKRQKAFYNDFIRPTVREGLSLALSAEDIMTMVKTAMEEGAQQ